LIAGASTIFRATSSWVATFGQVTIEPVGPKVPAALAIDAPGRDTIRTGYLPRRGSWRSWAMEISGKTAIAAPPHRSLRQARRKLSRYGQTRLIATVVARL